ncbi:unnamed protein product [Didymodactylos carnosus]|uniref:Uncharacterized protein n=1 Tax=Didymodactylos carnosus TaxID=1234261 RepID=A0A815DR78_9BILA|nr:unnamed protein product [Didymodactylos carnosus]CAF4125659.1 unnamed protein product [Didymodactylos carnosus]
MDALKAGAHKVQEAAHGHKAEHEAKKACDPDKKPSDRMDAAHCAAKHEAKAQEHACRADCKVAEHKH